MVIKLKKKNKEIGNEHYKTAKKKKSSYNLFVHYMLMNKTKICPVRRKHPQSNMYAQFEKTIDLST